MYNIFYCRHMCRHTCTHAHALPGPTPQQRPLSSLTHFSTCSTIPKPRDHKTKDNAKKPTTQNHRRNHKIHPQFNVDTIVVLHDKHCDQCKGHQRHAHGSACSSDPIQTIPIVQNIGTSHSQEWKTKTDAQSYKNGDRACQCGPFRRKG